MARNRFSFDRQGDVLVCTGIIDEGAQLPKLPELAINGRIVLDLAGVTFINSIGVREWIRMQRAAAQAQLRVELRRVPDVLVHQLNIVTTARGSSSVSSFFAPYVCEGCDREELRLIEVAQHGKDLERGQAPQTVCPSCAKPMSLAYPAEFYLGLLR